MDREYFPSAWVDGSRVGWVAVVNSRLAWSGEKAGIDE